MSTLTGDPPASSTQTLKSPTLISVLIVQIRLTALALMELSGLRMSINSDGEELKQYSVEVSPDGKKANCWVPSQSGKVRHPNAAKWTMKLRNCEGVCGELRDWRILGHRRQGKVGTCLCGWPQNWCMVISPTTNPYRHPRCGNFRQCDATVYVCRYSDDRYRSYSLPNHSATLKLSFVFLDYPDEDAPFDEASANSDQIGTISVRIFLVESWRRRSNSFSREYGIRDHPPAVINERTKKAGVHCVS